MVVPEAFSHFAAGFDQLNDGACATKHSNCFRHVCFEVLDPELEMSEKVYPDAIAKGEMDDRKWSQTALRLDKADLEVSLRFTRAVSQSTRAR